MNFSKFGGYSTRRQKNKIKSVITQIEENKMLLLTYTLIPKDAKHSESDKEPITTLLTQIRGSLK
ncbi:MAG: heme-binding domain-containing protein [Lutibacter sp.]